MRIILFLLGMSINFISSGAIIYIKGLPMALEYRNEMYIFPPSNVVPSNTTTFYITMDGVNKICILDTHVAGVFAQVTQVDFLMDGVRTEWSCYAYETTVIKVLPW